MTILIDDFLDEVRPDVPGCPENTMLMAARSALIELCEKTNIWRETLALINVVQGNDSYPLAPATADTVAHMPVYVAYNQSEIKGYPEETLDRIDRGWRFADEGVPTAFIAEPGGVLQLNRKPKAAITGGLYVRTSLKPAADAEGVDDFLFNNWHEAVAHGAKRRLMEVVGKKWSNPDMSLFHGRKFNYYVGQANSMAMSGGVKSNTSVQMVQW